MSKKGKNLSPDVNAQIMAERLAYSLDRGRHFKRASYYILRKLMDYGEVRGADVIILFKADIQKARSYIFHASKTSKIIKSMKEVIVIGANRCKTSLKI